MLEDVLTTLAEWRNCPAVSLVTSDPRALDFARRFEFDVIEERENRSETDAIEMASRVCEECGVLETLVIPGDIPLLQHWELETIYVEAPAEGTVLAPSSDGRGSNAVLRRPARLFPLRFGNDSFHPHLRAAQATGKPVRVLRLPGIGLDVDTPEDLDQLMAVRADTRAQQLLRAWGSSIGERLAAGA
jgi:2-phospho-L-lactate guanylyltransferase